MRLSIILLTWNSEAFAKQCLNSIYENIKITDFEVIIVDNGSSDNTCEIISTEFPKAKFIRNTNNMGVAPARNQGIRAANGEYILLLDIDTTIKQYAIDAMIDFMDNNQEVALCGPKLVFSDGAVQNSCRKFPLLQSKILRRVNNLWARKILEREYYKISDITESHLFADYVIGACQLIRNSAINQVGLLDDRIFYGPEDVDYCLRMWLGGWKVAYLADATVVHFEQRITKKRIFSLIMLKHIQGLFYYFIKYKYCFSREKLYKRIKNVIEESRN